jgi:hypothetical protein
MYTGELYKYKKMNKHALKARILIGKKDNPKAFILRSEIPDYCDGLFYQMHEVWENYNMGFGLPDGLSWNRLKHHVYETVKIFEKEYRYIRG